MTLTATQVQTMFNAIDYAAEMGAWYRAQSDQRRAEIADYRQGWYICVAGGRECDCGTDAMRAGWSASFDADPYMWKVGVRA